MFEPGGDMGVSFFFILSGFLMSQGYMTKVTTDRNRFNLPRFIVKRLSKLYPLHIICLIGSIILKVSINWYDISNLLLLQSWIPFKEWYFSGNAVGWCLSDFLFFYGMFPFLCNFLKSRRRLFLNIYFGTLLLYIFIIIPLVPTEIQYGIVYINPLTRLLDFIFGILLWEFFKSLDTDWLHIKRIIRIGDVILIFIITTMVSCACPSPYNYSVLWWPAHAILILYAAYSTDQWLVFKPLVKFGDVSFSFFLIHVLNIKYMDILFKKLNLEPAPSVRLFAILSMTIILSFLVHYFFVVPVEKFIRNKFTDKGSKYITQS